MVHTIKRFAWSLGLTVVLGFAFVPSGCGSVQPVMHVPEGIAGQLKACAVRHSRHVGAEDHTVTFDVKLTYNGQVDSITLVDSDVGDEELEACMASSLRSLTEEDLPLRNAQNVDRELATPQSRMLLGHPTVLAACLASPPCLLSLVVLMGATAITVQIMVHAATTTAKPTATTTAPPIAVPRRWPGQTCENTELDRLQKEKGKICNLKGGYAVNCSGDLKDPAFNEIPCSAVKLSILQRQACLAARWAVQDQCFGGKPDARHEKPIDETQGGIDNCEALKLKVCAQGHPMAGK